jgi:ribosomal protein S18 acetylase RimI-like enzyme
MGLNKILNFTYSDLRAELFRLKSKEMKTNFFIQETQFNRLLIENKIELFKTENASFFLCDEIDFKRLYFIISAAADLESFMGYLKTIYQSEISVEIAGNAKYVYEIKEIFLQNGFYEYSSMIRMSKIRKVIEAVSFENIYLFSSDKKDEIITIYNRYFDKFVERIPNGEEIDGFIKNQNAYYFSDNNEIQGFIVFENYGITSHLRYWFVHPDYREKKIGSKLIKLFFNIGENVKRELFWVIDSNYNAIKRYKYFGFVEEDMHNLILINRDKKYEEQNY